MATLGLEVERAGRLARFEADVVNPSLISLVLLQFWAEWCGPASNCRRCWTRIAADYAAKGVKLVRSTSIQDEFLAAQLLIGPGADLHLLPGGSRSPTSPITAAKANSPVLDELLKRLKIEGEGPAHGRD